jgi:capsular polysaccharide biosynthesis protein
MEIFTAAKVITGAHGGGMYTQLSSPTECVVVDIVTVASDGTYPDQATRTQTPSFSHTAVRSNSLLVSQKFWRYCGIATCEKPRISPWTSANSCSSWRGSQRALNDARDERLFS